jgi:hypothetical protein
VPTHHVWVVEAGRKRDAEDALFAKKACAATQVASRSLFARLETWGAHAAPPTVASSKGPWLATVLAAQQRTFVGASRTGLHNCDIHMTVFRWRVTLFRPRVTLRETVLEAHSPAW